MLYVGFGAGGFGVGSVLVILLALLLLYERRRAPRSPDLARAVGRIPSPALALVPGAALVFLSYHGGGFFPGPTSLVAVVFALILGVRLLLGSGGGPRGRLQVAIALAFAVYAIWVSVSAAWSRAPERALTEANLVLIYGLGFALCAGGVRTSRDVRWVVRGLALGASVVCLGAFLSRVLPRLWPIAATLDTDRVSYPLTYQNALGMVAAVGGLLCLGLTCDDREPRVARTLSALAVPLLAATLLMTYSRGAIACGVVGLVAFLLCARPRLLPSVALALVPTTAVAVIAVYRAHLLAYSFVDSLTIAPGGNAGQGHRTAAVVAACALAAAWARWRLGALDRRLLRRGNRGTATGARPRLPWVWVASLGVLGLAAIAIGASGLPARWYAGFARSSPPPASAAIRHRLTDPGSDGRVELWRVAVDEFEREPLRGAGAGTYALAWAVHRPASNLQAQQVFDAHSVYLENLAELGVVGCGLLICVVLASLLSIARPMRGSERTLYAAAFAVALAWALHAGLDWDWEMPAVTLPVFVLAGAAVGRPHSAAGGRRRPLLALLVLALAIPSALLAVSQHHRDASLAAFDRNDCGAASRAASSSLVPLSFRREPREIVAYCDAARGQPTAAVAEMRRAVRSDPGSWEPRYGLAVVLAAAGGDPRPAAQAAVSLNPHDTTVAATEQRLLDDPPTRWPADAAVAPLPIAGEYGPVLADLRSGQPRRPGPLSSPGPLADAPGHGAEPWPAGSSI